jgi:hypothetical protein
MIEQIPLPQQWKAIDLKPDYGRLKTGASLFFRNPLHLIATLLGRPKVAATCQFKPCRVWDNVERTERQYSEMWTGDWWWRMQVRQLVSAG